MSIKKLINDIKKTHLGILENLQRDGTYLTNSDQ